MKVEERINAACPPVGMDQKVAVRTYAEMLKSVTTRVEMISKLVDRSEMERRAANTSALHLSLREYPECLSVSGRCTNSCSCERGRRQAVILKDGQERAEFWLRIAKALQI